MAPTRTERSKYRPTPSSSTPGAGPSNPKKSFKPQKKQTQGSKEDTVPGVQKIKAALRQTRRLLARDKLAADVRVATERRQKALEGDLAKAERIKRERAIGQRYHKVKFFERQKVTRKIQQLKRKLAKGDEDGEPLSEEDRQVLEEQLTELRVDLNYILNYPRMKKYISLFPPEIRASGDPTTKAHQKQKEIASETDAQREEIRAWVRAQMENGEMGGEPEIEVQHSEKTKKVVKRPAEDAVGGLAKKTKAGMGNGRTKENTNAQNGVAGDDFFGADSGDEDDAQGGDEDVEMGEEDDESESSEESEDEDSS